jgi:hypothetical protein
MDPILEIAQKCGLKSLKTLRRLRAPGTRGGVLARWVMPPDSAFTQQKTWEHLVTLVR